MSEAYIGHSSVQNLHALSEQLDFLLFYETPEVIFLDFLHEFSFTELSFSRSFSNVETLLL